MSRSAVSSTVGPAARTTRSGRAGMGEKRGQAAFFYAAFRAKSDLEPSARPPTRGNSTVFGGAKCSLSPFFLLRLLELDGDLVAALAHAVADRLLEHHQHVHRLVGPRLGPHH